MVNALMGGCVSGKVLQMFVLFGTPTIKALEHLLGDVASPMLMQFTLINESLITSGTFI